MAGSFDKNALLLAQQNIGTGVTGTWFDLKPRLNYDGMNVQTLITDAVASAGSVNVTTVIESSADGSTVNGTVGIFPTLSVGTTGLKPWEYSKTLRIHTDYGQRWIRAKAIVTGGTLSAGKIKCGPVFGNNNL